jgi:DMSO reductase anchor subunit
MLLIGSTGMFVLLYIIMLGTGFSDLARKFLAALGFISGVLTAFEMGAIYILPARPAWNTWFWSFIYAASAAVTGLFTMYIWAATLDARIGDSVTMGINKATLISLVILGGSILAYMIFLDEAPYKEDKRKPGRLLVGDLSFAFWAGVIFSGLVVPLGMTAYIQATREAHFSVPVGVIGFIGALIGGITIRALMYRLGSEADPILS